MGTRAPRCAAATLALVAGLALAGQGLAQTSEQKPPPAAKEAATKSGGAPPPAAPKPRAPERKPGDERIRLDAPVSFPVDI